MPAKKTAKSSKKTPPDPNARRQKNPAARSTKTRQEPLKPSFWSSLTLDRKLDILGIGMVLIGLLTLLSLLSSNNGWLSSGWLTMIGKSFGWGMYLLPVGLMALGLWLILRHFEQLPQTGTRSPGWSILFFHLTAWLAALVQLSW